MRQMHKFFLPIFILAVFLLASAGPVQAAGPTSLPREGKVVFGGNYTLASGETLNGDLAVLGGNADIQKDATVQGGVFLAGGNLSVDGEVQGDVVLLGGNLSLGSTALVNGDVNSIGGSLNRASGAQILGQVITNERALDLALPHSLFTPRYSFNFDPLMKVLGWFFQALALAALAMIVVMLAPNPTNRVANTAITQPITAGGIGLLTAILAPFVLLLMIITLIGIPVALIAIMALVIAVTFGWIGLGLELGRRMETMFNARWSDPLSAGLGTFILSLVANGIGFIPCVGWLAPFLISIVGLGAVILTRFGSMNYPANVYIAPTPQTPAGGNRMAPPASYPSAEIQSSNPTNLHGDVNPPTPV